MVRIDTAAVNRSPAGNYLITYSLRSDKSQTGTIAFTNQRLACDHFDRASATPLCTIRRKTRPSNTIIIGMFDSLARA